MAGLQPFNYGNVIAQAEGIKGARIGNALNQQKLDQNALNGGAGDPTYGKQVQYAMDENEKLRGFSVGDDGTVKELKLPEGMTWADTYSAKDIGGLLQLIGRRTGIQKQDSAQPGIGGITSQQPITTQQQQSGRFAPIKKTLPPEKTPEYLEAVEKVKAGVQLKTKPEIESAVTTAKIEATDTAKRTSPEAVAARASSYREAKAAYDLITELLGDGKDNVPATKAFGKVVTNMPEVMRPQDTLDAQAMVSQIQSLLALESRMKLKGSGTISDNEQRTLEKSATLLSNPYLSDGVVIKEMKRVQEIFKNAMQRQVDLGYTEQETTGQQSQDDPLGLF